MGRSGRDSQVPAVGHAEADRRVGQGQAVLSRDRQPSVRGVPGLGIVREKAPALGVGLRPGGNDAAVGAQGGVHRAGVGRGGGSTGLPVSLPLAEMGGAAGGGLRQGNGGLCRVDLGAFHFQIPQQPCCRALGAGSGLICSLTDQYIF